MSKWNPFEKKESQDGTQSKSEADLLIEKLGTVIDEKMKPYAEKVDALAGKFTKIEESAEAEIARAEEEARRKTTEGLTDEEKRNNRERALFELNVHTNARITENSCLDKVRAEWPNIVPQIEAWFKTVTVEQKARPDYPQLCERIVAMAVGQEAMKGGLRFNRNSSRFIIEDSAGSSEGDRNEVLSSDFDWVDPKNPNHVLSAGKQLSVLGIDPKEFEKFVKGPVV